MQQDMHLDPFVLKSGEIHFFYTCLDELKGSDLLKEYRSVISEKEMTKVDRYMFEKDQHACLVTRALLRYLLSICTHKAPRYFDFFENAYGKPDLKQGLVDLPVKFNLSHSSGVTACALTLENDIGMDVEDYRRKVDVSISNRYFAPSEAADVKKCSQKHGIKRFFDFWTLKESYIKARGMGLSIALDRFSFDIAANKITIRFDPSLEDTPEQWQFFKFSPIDNYMTAISVRTTQDPPFKLNIYNCIPFEKITRQENTDIML